MFYMNSLDFTEILNMPNLINSIKTDEFLSPLYFYVKEIKSLRADIYKGYKKEEKYYQFGNKKYNTNLDKVTINAYIDYVELYNPRLSKVTITKTLNVNAKHTLEYTILLILDEWRKYFDF